MSKRRPVSDADASLFRRLAGPVKRLRTERVVLEPERASPGPGPRRREPPPAPWLADDPADSASGTGDEISFRRPGLQHRLWRDLRRGQIRIGAELDLHGMTAANAHRALERFLEDCRGRGIRCARVIHGKGLRSEDGRPVIKRELGRWLRHRADVLAVCSARRDDGGTGAAYVLLRRD